MCKSLLAANLSSDKTKLAFLLVAALALPGCVGTRAATRVTDNTQPAYSGKVCIIPAVPSGLSYKSVGHIDTYMHHYGSSEFTLDGMANEARRMGADAVLGVEYGQEFGYFPWRLLRPRSKGFAVRLADPSAFDCAKEGGMLR